MIISFEDQELLDSCVELSHAEEVFGSEHAAALVTFISDADASENADDLIALLVGDVELSASDSLLVKIGTDYRAELAPVGKRFRRGEDGRIDWVTVTRLKVLNISRVN